MYATFIWLNGVAIIIKKTLPENHVTHSTCQMFVCVPDVYLIIIQCCRAVSEWCNYFELGQLIRRILLTSDWSTCQVPCRLPSLFTIIATQCHISMQQISMPMYMHKH